MKIMQINVVYKTGSTGKIVYELHSYLEKHNITSIVCYGRGNSVKEKMFIRLVVNLTLK